MKSESFLCAMLFLLPGCTTSEAYELSENQQHQCMKIFTEILNIQDKRNSLSDEMNAINRLRKDKKISKKKHKAFFVVWLAKENHLAARANDLYIEGYAKNCFREMKSNEENLGVDE